MKTLFLIALLSLCVPSGATTYYLANASTSPAGSDANNGTSAATPWLTPNHALNCGDQIIAVASTAYSHANFTTGKWGTVTCAAGNNVAWLTCANFDACKISDSNDYDLATMWVDKSYWGVQGWEVSNGASPYASCFGAYRNTVTPIQIHHIIFANDIANGCGSAGFASANEGNLFGVDYYVIIGNIAYNGAQTTTVCGSGITMFQPVASDTLPGTHLYIAGNFSYQNVDGNPCNNGTPTDGEGVVLDTLAGSDTEGLPAYAQQVAVVNNMFLFNGQAGLETNASTSAPIFIVNNTLVGNDADPNISSGTCGQLVNATFSVPANLIQTYGNIARATGGEAACPFTTIYAYYAYGLNATDHIFANYAYNAASSNNFGIGNNAGFAYGPNNVAGADPAFPNPVAPGAPSCGSATSVPNCMATVIANFTPTAAAAIPYGYQPVSTTSRYDPLYPQWLCSVTNLPTGLVTPGCVVGEHWN